MKRSTLSPRLFTLLLMGEAAAYAAAKWPHQMFLDRYAFEEPGATLTADWLVAEGWLPGRDFNYLYGLLTLLVGRVVFGVFGGTPGVYAVATSLMAVGIAASLAHLASTWKAPLPAQVFLILALPFAIDRFPPLNLAHSLEALLLAVALVLHSRGQVSWALAAAAMAVLTKPALGYVYGLVLLGQLAYQQYRGGWHVRTVGHALGPAVVTSACLLLLLSACFSVESLLRSLLPFPAGEVYRRENFGFFRGEGQFFWRPPGANYRYYLGTAAGFWLAGTVYLILIALGAWVRREYRAFPVFPIVITCALLHLVFILVGFSNGWAWTYYSHLLVAGIAASAAWGRWTSRLVLFLGLAAALGQYAVWRDIGKKWGEYQRSAACAGLYAPPPVAEDWQRLRDLGRQRRVFVLNYLGAAFLLAPELDSTRAWCLYWWMATPREMEDTLSRLRQAEVVVIPKAGDFYRRPTHPQHGEPFASELQRFPCVVEWPTMILYGRREGVFDAH